MQHGVKLNIMYFQSAFSQMHEYGNISINANLVIRNIYSFLLYLHYVTLVNVNLDIRGYGRITFHLCRLAEFLFSMIQLKQSRQYWHSFIM